MRPFPFASLRPTRRRAFILPAVVGNHLTTPDSTILDFQGGDMDITVGLWMDDWTPAAAQYVLAKAGASGQRAYDWSILSTGEPLFRVSTTGAAFALLASPGVAPTIPNGAPLYLRVTLDGDNGAGGCTTTFYTSSNGLVWTALGSPVVQAGTITPFLGTEIFALGAQSNSNAPLGGGIFHLAIRSVIDGPIVVEMDPSRYVSGDSFSSRTGEVWTINRSGLNPIRLAER